MPALINANRKLMMRTLPILLFPLLISGCSIDMPGIFLAPHEKVTKAFPPKAEVTLALERIRSQLTSDPSQLKAFEKQFEALLEIRALTCAQGLTIGRFDSVEHVQTLPINRDCLYSQDTKLIFQTALRHISIRLAQPPLRPLQPLGQATPFNVTGINGYSLVAASEAGVGIVRGHSSELATIEIPGNKRIVPLGTIQNSSQPVIAPNGRIAAFRTGNRSVLFIDLETGEKLLETEELANFLAWSPSTKSGLATSPKEGALQIVDFELGQLTPASTSLRNQSWSLPLDSAGQQILVGQAQNISLIVLKRDKNGVQDSLTKQIALKKGTLSENRILLMRDGKSVFSLGNRGLMRFDIDTEEEALWPVSDFFSYKLAKINETQVLVDIRTKPGADGIKHMVFDIANETLTELESGLGMLGDFSGRAGYIRLSRDGQKWLGDSVELKGNPIPLSTAIETFNSERQMARIEAENQMIEYAASALVGKKYYPGSPSARSFAQ